MLHYTNAVRSLKGARNLDENKTQHYKLRGSIERILRQQLLKHLPAKLVLGEVEQIDLEPVQASPKRQKRHCGSQGSCTAP